MRRSTSTFVSPERLLRRHSVSEVLGCLAPWQYVAMATLRDQEGTTAACMKPVHVALLIRSKLLDII